ncbi:hypothetical protein FRB90_012604, partial [Tulasnella sp. 427]
PVVVSPNVRLSPFVRQPSGLLVVPVASYLPENVRENGRASNVPTPALYDSQDPTVGPSSRHLLPFNDPTSSTSHLASPSESVFYQSQSSAFSPARLEHHQILLNAATRTHHRIRHRFPPHGWTQPTNKGYPPARIRLDMDVMDR